MRRRAKVDRIGDSSRESVCCAGQVCVCWMGEGAGRSTGCFWGGGSGEVRCAVTARSAGASAETACQLCRPGTFSSAAGVGGRLAVLRGGMHAKIRKQHSWSGGGGKRGKGSAGRSRAGRTLGERRAACVGAVGLGLLGTELLADQGCELVQAPTGSTQSGLAGAAGESACDACPPGTYSNGSGAGGLQRTRTRELPVGEGGWKRRQAGRGLLRC
jgi:hypothetical protein